MRRHRRAHGGRGWRRIAAAGGTTTSSTTFDAELAGVTPGIVYETIAAASA
ncbi:hypothetical protein [Vulcanimicrobium alpinum]|uniref:hypothetical protein n=1 Tax=Vulcanimicrobium alpinum TaxID=3016050 RepID=UPI00295F0A65|nr:hypothetical protein [Vulcanimicrobium alpinum]